MQLISNASKWHKLWSIRLALLSAVLAAVEASVPLWNGILAPNVFAALSGAVAVASAVARVIQQPSAHNDQQL